MKVLVLNTGAHEVESLAKIAEEIPQVTEIIDTISARQVLVHAREDDPRLLICQSDPDSKETLEFFQDLLTVNPIIRCLLVARQKPSPDSPILRMNRLHFLPSPFRQQGAATLLKWLLDPSTENSVGLFAANLKNIRILDLLQLKAHAGASCALTLTSNKGEKGELAFLEGRIIHAECENLTGEEAFRKITLFEGGTITEASFDPAGHQTLHRPTVELILDTARYMDETMIHSATPSGANTGVIPVKPPEDETKPIVPEIDPERFESMPKVLVVDDSPEVLAALQQMLIATLPDYAIITVESALEALECIPRYRPKVVVLDFFMPDLNGDLFCKRLEDNSDTATIPIILISGNEAILSDMQSTHENVKAVLTKPFSSADLVREIKKLTELPLPAEGRSP